LRRTVRPTSSAADAAALLVREAPGMWSVVLACHDRCGDRFCAGRSCGLLGGAGTVLRTRPGTCRVISGSGYPCGRIALLDERPPSNVATNSQALFARAADHVHGILRGTAPLDLRFELVPGDSRGCTDPGRRGDRMGAKAASALRDRPLHTLGNCRLGLPLGDAQELGETCSPTSAAHCTLR